MIVNPNRDRFLQADAPDKRNGDIGVTSPAPA
jgi:hypothetical protein